MNHTVIAQKTKTQFANFLGKVFTHFSKPTRRFIGEMLYGIQALGDSKLRSRYSLNTSKNLQMEFAMSL